MDCEDCGKPYMAGLEFTMEGGYFRCKKCYDIIKRERGKSLRIEDQDGKKKQERK